MREICQVITTFSGFHLLRYPGALSGSRLSPLTAVISNDIWNYCADRYRSRVDSAVRSGRRSRSVTGRRMGWPGREDRAGEGFDYPPLCNVTTSQVVYEMSLDQWVFPASVNI